MMTSPHLSTSPEPHANHQTLFFPCLVLESRNGWPHLLRLSPNEDAQYFTEEAGKQRVEWRLVLQEPVQFHE